MEGKNEVAVETPEELSTATKVLAKSIAKWTGNKTSSIRQSRASDLADGNRPQSRQAIH